ncbi:transposase [Micromonospora endolithica]|uniref:transposase n=1 Tax=Micromonospora endolithica TaxID=230091 RepID=UPI00307B8000
MVPPWPRPLRSRVRCLGRRVTATGLSGNTTRYRLNRGGDQRLNRALYTVALVRMGHDPRTRDYVTRRPREGRTKREIMRSLERYISRQLFRTLNGAYSATSTT